MKTEFVKLTEDTRISVAEDTQYVIDFSDLNLEDINTLSLTLVFEKQGISAQIIGVYKLQGNTSVKLTTVTDHKVPNTSCITRIKGVLLDSAKSEYIGKILIEKPAQQTSSFLEDNVLLLGDGCKNGSQPILEIEADDVKASHGATTGRIDQSQIYYLASRGLNVSEAESLIVEGFFESLTKEINDAKIREKVANLVKN